MSDPLKVVYICADTSGPYYHDIHVPSNYFNQLGLLTCSVATGAIKLESVADQDIIVFQRQYAAEALMTIRMLKKQGKVCIFVVDDNVWNIHKTSPAHPYYTGQNLERYNVILSEAHAFWTSTEHLRILGLRFNKNGTVLRNLVEPVFRSFLRTDRDNPEQVRIGWTGTPHHYADILYIEPALKQIAKKYKDKIKYVFMGYKPPYIHEWMSRWEYEYYDFVPPDAFYPALASLDFDIGIAPLVDNEFNRGKTARKAQEYGLFSIPSILSPCHPYHEWSHGVTCLKPKNNKVDAWVYSLSQMIDNADLRKEIGEAGYKYVMDNHNINKFIVERAQFFYDVYNSVKQTDRKIPEPEVIDAKSSKSP